MNQPELFATPKNIGRTASKDRRTLDPSMREALRARSSRAQTGWCPACYHARVNCICNPQPKPQ